MSNGIDTETLSRLPHIEAPLNYLAPMAEKPRTYTYDPPPGVPMRTGHSERHLVKVFNGRPVADRLTLDDQGFCFGHGETAISNFLDSEEVRAVYYPEVERLMKEITGAEKVVVFDHNVRCRPMAKEGVKGVREPVKYAHNDYTLKSGPQRVRDLLEPAEAEERLKHRFAIINLWRPIKGPVEESPLGVCDARSMVMPDFVATDLLYRDRTGEVYSVAYNPDHLWFYFPRMQRDEVLLLKCYDSAADGRARFTAHSAFADPTSPPDAAPRESIEARTLVFYRD